MFETFFWGKGGSVNQPAEGSYAYYMNIDHVAALAERTKAEIFSVSVEMSSANPQEAHLRKPIGGVWRIFSGKLHCGVASAAPHRYHLLRRLQTLSFGTYSTQLVLMPA